MFLVMNNFSSATPQNSRLSKPLEPSEPDNPNNALSIREIQLEKTIQFSFALSLIPLNTMGNSMTRVKIEGYVHKNIW